MITFDSVSKTFPNGTRAVHEFTLEVAEGETVVLLGTSGSGKTTTMKMVNRLIDPSAGRITVDGKDVMQCNRVELRRGIGYAIQHIGLFPHMTVGQNIAVVPKLLKWRDGKIRDRVDTLLAMVGLEPDEYRDRYPNQLSGGQRQRIGVARALASDPPIVLMDEPFGALDPITRDQLQNEFLELESEIRKTILFVTHDVFEAVKMGDRVALLDGGCLQQLSTPAELVDHPQNQFVDQFLGHHRFQLALYTRTVASVMPKDESAADAAGPDAMEPPGHRPDVYLSARASLVTALDTFKEHRKDSLPVYRRREYLGELHRRYLLQQMASTLGDVS